MELEWDVVSQYFLTPAPPWRAVLLPLPLTLFSPVTSDSPHLIWSLIPAWRRARGCQWEGPLDLLLKECLLSSQDPVPPPPSPSFHLSPIWLSLTSLSYKPNTVFNVEGPFWWNTEAKPPAHSTCFKPEYHKGHECGSGKNKRPLLRFPDSGRILLLLTSLQREGGGLKNWLSCHWSYLGPSQTIQPQQNSPLLFICVPSSLDHKLLTAGNVSESHVFPEPSSVHCTWVMLSKAFRKKMWKMQIKAYCRQCTNTCFLSDTPT